MRRVNGQIVPENLSVDELSSMMETTDVKVLAVACSALQALGTHEAYMLLKHHVNTQDRCKRRLVYSVIFSFPESSELKNQFRKALLSKDLYFVFTVLNHLVHKNLWVSEADILTCFRNHHNQLSSYYYQILYNISRTEDNTQQLLKWMKTAKTDSIRIAVAECLEYVCTEENYLPVLSELQHSPISKIRMVACRIAKNHERCDLLKPFEGDSDGHIRKFVQKYNNSQ